MCFSYAVNFNAEALKSKFLLEELILPASGFFFSAFTWPELPVLEYINGHWVANNKHWGLIPAWCKSEEQALELRKLSLNAKGETVNEKPMFRHAFQAGRCLIPAAGFFEWREVNKKKYPYFIHAAQEEFLLMAGISDLWVHKETGEEIASYSIVTTEANALMRSIHNTKMRMPLILPASQAEEWVKGSELAALDMVKPCDEKLLKAHTIPPLASKASADRNVPEVQQAYHYAELDIQTLF